MNDFEIIDKSISILYMQDDLLAMLSLIKTVDNGESKYGAIETNLNKFITALKNLEPINLGEGASSITLEQLLTNLEEPRNKLKALTLLQKHHQEIVTKINLQAAMKKKNATINGLGIIMYGYSLINSIYSARTLAPLLTAVHTLAKENDYNHALECFKNSENAPYYLYNLLMPVEVVTNDNEAKDKFLENIDKHYQNSGMHKKINPSLKKRKFEDGYYYEMLYWVFSYFSEFENYKTAYNKIASQTKESEKYYIISKDLYKDFPKPIQGDIDERLRSVLVSAESTQQKANKYFKGLEEIKIHADALRDHKRQKVDLGLKQAILMSKLNLAVAMLHELGIRLSNLDIEIKKDLSLPQETVINTQKLPRFIEWRESLDKFISQLDNKRDTFACLVYHRLMSAILTKYDSLSKIYDEIYRDTAYDDKNIRGIVQEKARMIASIQMNPLKLLKDVCAKNSIEKEDQGTITRLFIDTHSQIIPITENCLEEFSYATQFNPKKQYEIAKKETHRHPLYPLMTIYSEWYKLRSFILFFENFGNNNSSYLRGFEKTRGVAFECLYKDLVYLSYAFGAIYNELDQSAQGMVLKYMAIFSIAPNNRNYHLAFKKFAILESCIFSHEIFNDCPFQDMLNHYIEKENLSVSNQFKDFINNHKKTRIGFSIKEINQRTRTLSYQANGHYQFDIIITNDEYLETQNEINQLAELGGRPALTAIAMIVFIKNYNDNFLIQSLSSIDTFWGFYTEDIFAAWRRAGIKNQGQTLRFVNLENDRTSLQNLKLDLESYSTSKNEKIRANQFVKQQCQNLIRCFTDEGIRLDLDQLKRTLDTIEKMLKTKVITKAIGKSKCKQNLTQAKLVFNNIYQKLIYLDICCFSQYSITGLKPFKANRSFIDMMAHYLTKTFVRNKEVEVTRHMDLGMIEGIENPSLEVIPFKAENQISFKPSYENDCEILGIIKDSETGKEIVPRDTSNKFYVFLKMMTKMCEYYMDSIISIFGDSYDKKDYTRFDKFLDKLLEDFQMAINTDFKQNYLDKTIDKFKLNSTVVNLYVIFTLNTEDNTFKENNNFDLVSLNKFIEESISHLDIRSFDKVKFFDSSYREFSLIEKFRKTYDELESTYSFMNDNKDFIILSNSDLFDIYNIKDSSELNVRFKSNDPQTKTLKAIFDDERTKSFKLDDLKNAVDSYELYLTKHVIFPEYNENTVLACGLLCYEYNQIITIIYQDFLERSNEYQGRYDFKWWHAASLGLGAAIDYFYTTSNLAKGIKEIQTTLDNQQDGDTNQQIEKIIAIANSRLQKNSKRKDNVRLLYDFLSKDLSEYIEKKRQLSSNNIRTDFKFKHVSEADDSNFEQYSNYLNKPKSASKEKIINPVNHNAIEIDINDPQVVAVSQNLTSLHLFSDDLYASSALEIVCDITSHRINRASLISNGFIDVCIGKRHQQQVIINLDEVDRFLIKPCRTVLSNEIEQEDILTPINQLITNSINSIIFLPINHGNWHFTLLIINTANNQIFFFDSFGDGRIEWVRAYIISKLRILRGYTIDNLTENFQYNNDCGFLVLNLIDQIYQRNNRNMDMRELYSAIIEEYNGGEQSGFLRQYFCNYAGEPFSTNNWIFHYEDKKAI